VLLPLLTLLPVAVQHFVLRSLLPCRVLCALRPLLLLPLMVLPALRPLLLLPLQVLTPLRPLLLLPLQVLTPLRPLLLLHGVLPSQGLLLLLLKVLPALRPLLLLLLLARMHAVLTPPLLLAEPRLLAAACLSVALCVVLLHLLLRLVAGRSVALKTLTLARLLLWRCFLVPPGRAGAAWTLA
jgi:hypothetical protein